MQSTEKENSILMNAYHVQVLQFLSPIHFQTFQVDFWPRGVLKGESHDHRDTGVSTS